MTTSASTKILKSVVAPNLPIPTIQYSQTYSEILNNVLRLYFNQLDASLNLLSDQNGGAVLSFPNGAFHQDGTTTLTTGITNTSTTPIVVGSTAGFPSSGYFLIGSEIIKYTSTTSTTFAGTITRGALGTTNVAHTAGAAISEVQGTGSSTTIGIMQLNNTDYSSNVAINPLDITQIVFTTAGLYNIQFSAQLLSYANADDNVTIWVRQNGVDVPATGGIATVPAIHGGIPGAIIAGWNYFLRVNSGDYLQLCWVTDSGNSVVATFPVGTSPVHPSSPALILTAAFVSA